MSKRPSYLLALLAVLVPLLGLPTMAAALDNKGVDLITHFAQCAQWMLTDPAKHAQFCSPGTSVFVSSGGSGAFRTSTSESTSSISISIPSDSTSSGDDDSTSSK